MGEGRKNLSSGKVSDILERETKLSKLWKAKKIDEFIQEFELLDASKGVGQSGKNMAIRAYGMKKNISAANRLFEILLAEKNADVYSYGAMLSALCNVDRIDDAYALIESMKSSNVRPNLIMYNTLLHAAITKGKQIMAHKLRQDIESLQLGSSEMYLIGLMRIESLSGSIHSLREVWKKEIESIYSSKQHVGFAALAWYCTALAKLDCPEQAVPLLEKLCDSEMFPMKYEDALTVVDEDGWQKVLQKPRASDRQSGLNSNVANNKHIRAAFDTTIASLCRRRDIARVNQVVQIMSDCRLEPSASTIAALSKFLPMESTGEVFSASKKQTRGTNDLNLSLIKNFSQHLFNDVEARNAMLTKAALKSIEEVELLWEKLEEANWTPDICSFNILLTNYARVRNVEKAWNIFEQIKKRRLLPTESTCVSMIVVHSKLKRQDSAKFRIVEFVEEMKKLRIDHTVKTATALIRVYGQLGLCDQALMVLDDLKKLGIKPNIYSYNTMMNGFVDSREGTEMTLSYFVRMVGDGVQPDRYSYNILISACSEHEEFFGLAQFFLSFMIHSGLKPEADSFNSAMRVALMHSDPGAAFLQAKYILEDMISLHVTANENSFKTILKVVNSMMQLSGQSSHNLFELCFKAGSRPRHYLLEDVINSWMDEGKLKEGIGLFILAIKFDIFTYHKALKLEELIRNKLSEQYNEETRILLQDLQNIRQYIINKRPAVLIDARQAPAQ